MIQVTRIYALLIPFYLLSRLISNLLQVVKKAHYWAPVYIILINLQMVSIFFLADNHVDMAWIVVIFNMLICLTSFIMLLYFTHKFSLDTIKNLTKVNRA